MSRNVVELRVHGVAGVRAEGLLNNPVIIRVAGDRNAGFYRPRPGFGDQCGPAGVTIEAYQWRNLTTGSIVRTLSLLLLLPFMFTNLAVWLRPPAGRGTTVKALCRLLAASITVMFVLSVVGVALDLVGWQCVPYHPCVTGRRYLSWLGALPTGPRLVVLAVLPAAAIRLIWWVGSRSARAYEGFRPSYGISGAPGGDRLDARDFWSGEALVGRLRSIHVALAYGTLDASVLIALTSRNHDPVGYALIVATALLVTACLALLCLPSIDERDDERRWADTVIRPLRAATAAITVLTAGYALAPRPAVPVGGQMPGYGVTVNALVLGQAVLLTALAAVTFQQQRAAPPAARAFFHGLGGPVFGSVAVGLAAIFAAGLVFRAADVLDRGAIPSLGHPPAVGAPPLDPPVAYRWAALGALAAVLVVTVVGLYAGRFSRPRRDREATRISQQDFPDAPPQATPRIRAVRRSISRSRLAEQFGPLITAYFLLSLLSLAFTALDLAELGPTQVAARLSGNNSTFARLASYLTDAGTFSLGLIVFGPMMVGILAYFSPEVRRSVSVLWDLGTFFPRTTHPFAPPCYAERAVPELSERVSALTREQNVLLSGHSHGSALAAAAILQLPPETLRRVALLTYGSPLRRLYGHLMPAYFGDDVLHEIGERVGWRWRNLWRNTDPVGGAIFSDHRPGDPPHVNGPAGQVDVRLRDPRAVTVEPMDTVPPPIEAHWPYYTDARYDEAVGELADLLDPPGPGASS